MLLQEGSGSGTSLLLQKGNLQVSGNLGGFGTSRLPVYNMAPGPHDWHPCFRYCIEFDRPSSLMKSMLCIQRVLVSFPGISTQGPRATVSQSRPCWPRWTSLTPSIFLGWNEFSQEHGISVRLKNSQMNNWCWKLIKCIDPLLRLLH